MRNETEYGIDEEEKLLLGDVDDAVAKTTEAATTEHSTHEFPIYTTADFSENCLNRYRRFPDNSPIASYVVLSVSSYSTPMTMQYAKPPEASITNAFLTSPLKLYSTTPEIDILTKDLYVYGLPNGGLSMHGRTAHDCQMRSRRSYRIEMTYEDMTHYSYTFFPCSPTKKGETDDFDESVPRFLDSDENKKLVTEKGMTHESGEITLIKKDIIEREKVTSRTPDQNQTQGESAVNAAKQFCDTYKTYLTDAFLKMSMTSYQAKLASEIRFLKVSYEKLLLAEKALINAGINDESYQKAIEIDHEKNLIRQQMKKIIEEAPLRFEWLHGESYTNTPLCENPQRQDNLGAAMAWINTKMMILERTARWFAINVPGAIVKTQRGWEKFFDSQMLNHISFLVIIQIGPVIIQLPQEIDPYVKNPEYVKTSDIAGLIHVLCMLIRNIAPVVTKPVSIYASRPSLSTRPNVALFRPRHKIESDESDNEPPRKVKRLE